MGSLTHCAMSPPAPAASLLPTVARDLRLAARAAGLPWSA